MNLFILGRYLVIRKNKINRIVAQKIKKNLIKLNIYTYINEYIENTTCNEDTDTLLFPSTLYSLEQHLSITPTMNKSFLKK